jgi:hypothetical protein
MRGDSAARQSTRRLIWIKAEAVPTGFDARANQGVRHALRHNSFGCAMIRPISDRAEVSVDFPDKVYMGAFGHRAGFETKVEPDEVKIRLVAREGEKRAVDVHLHYYLLADILSDIANGLKAAPVDEAHRERLAKAVEALRAALAGRGAR